MELCEALIGIIMSFAAGPIHPHPGRGSSKDCKQDTEPSRARTGHHHPTWRAITLPGMPRRRTIFSSRRSNMMTDPPASAFLADVPVRMSLSSGLKQAWI